MPFIILDRDGVINYDSDAYIKSPEEWVPIPGSLEAIAHLNKHQYQVLVATNQSGVARGYYTLETLALIHQKFQRALAAVGGVVEEIYYCPHHPEAGCMCRKPRTGMFTQIHARYALDFRRTFYIGDSYTDVLVAQQVGCTPVLVLTGKGLRTLEEHPELAHMLKFNDLAEAAQYVITTSQYETSSCLGHT